MKFSSIPAAPFRHLQRLTDGVVPRHEHGYRAGDVAYGLVVVCREPSPPDELIPLGRRCLTSSRELKQQTESSAAASATTADGAASP